MSSNKQPPSRDILVTHNLIKIFQNNQFAVNGISFGVQKGEIVGLVGPNGAGKTTTLHMLLGTLQPTSGIITYFGKNFSTHRSWVLQQIGFASGSVQLPGALSVYQNLDIHMRLYGFNTAERTNKIESLLKRFDVWNLRNTQTGHLSSGQMNRIILAKAFSTNPAIVFLDEVTAGLDPEMAKEAQYFFMQQRDKYGTAIVLASHNMNEVGRMCDRMLIMKEGRIIANHNPADLMRKILKVRLSLMTPQIQKIKQLLKQYNVPYVKDANNIVIEIDEHNIASLLTKLAQQQISYDTISIVKPSLEDQFLRITAQEHAL